MNRTNRAPFTDLCYLRSTEKVYDETRHYEEKPVKREVFCSVTNGVVRSEFYEAFKAGVQLSITVEVWEDDYEQEKQLEYNDTRYNVQRVYPTGYGTLELSCAEVIQ